MILQCGCKDYMGVKFAAQFQDGKYGVGKRAFNRTSKDKTYRCTVCGKEKSTGEEPKK